MLKAKTILPDVCQMSARCLPDATYSFSFLQVLQAIWLQLQPLLRYLAASCDGGIKVIKASGPSEVVQSRWQLVILVNFLEILRSS